jgi:oligopeptide/dipeptide ABC transporter ATP-binding protein
MTQPILKITDLHKYFPVSRGIVDTLLRNPKDFVKAVDGVSFEMQRGEILALVGESGSGKTTVGMNVLGLQEHTRGEILFDGYNMQEWARGKIKSDPPGASNGMSGLSSRQQILALRRRAQMVFQDPFGSLIPSQTIMQIISEPIEVHGLAKDRAERIEKVREVLEICGLAPAEQFWGRLPDELSGGQRQRIVIASALSLEPDLLVADEPVSMLDVSIRAEILSLLHELRDEKNITILYTTHDLATAGYFTDRMAVMYLGRIMELGPTRTVLSGPQHPYTRALLSVIPVPNPRYRRKRMVLSGEIPNPVNIPRGCRFHPRCPLAIERCKEVDPELREIAPGHWKACILD